MIKRSLADLYLLKFNGEEMSLVPSTCLRPWACSCSPGNSDCGFTPEEVKTQLLNYYNDKASHISSLTPNELMVELGFYTYQ